MRASIADPSRRKALLLGAFLAICGTAMAQDAEWTPVTGADALRELMSGLTAERELRKGEISRAEYAADGTGTLHAWGASVPRTWSIEGEDQLCITAQRETLCYRLERNAADENLYRVRAVATGKVTEFRVAEGHGSAEGEPAKPGNEGGAAAPSAAELAAELSNPNTAVATMTFKLQHRLFEGDLPAADDQSSTLLLFQPGLPFVLASGAKIIWRPAVPILLDQPVPDAGGGFSGESGLGDIAFDLAYAPKVKPGKLLGFGVFTSLPTATDDLGSDRWTLGPEILLGKATPKYVLGTLTNHQWSVGGSGDADVSLTTIQVFYTAIRGGGWTVGSGPSITYDWKAEQWTVPLQINAGKTVIWNGRPWKLGGEINYYVEKADGFGPEWMLSFSVAPVVKNKLADWFGLGEE